MHILLVDNHPMVTAFYEMFLNDYFSNSTNLNISKAFNCEQAYRYVTISDDSLRYDITILDYNLPSFINKGMNSGIDIVGLLRRYYPDCKIVMITAHIEVLIVYEIIKKVQPEGIATKNDITAEVLMELFRKILTGSYYQSETVKKCTLTIWNNEILIDDNNRKIIFYLAKGYKVKDLDSL